MLSPGLKLAAGALREIHITREWVSSTTWLDGVAPFAIAQVKFDSVSLDLVPSAIPFVVRLPPSIIDATTTFLLAVFRVRSPLKLFNSFPCFLIRGLIRRRTPNREAAQGSGAQRRGSLGRTPV